MFCKNPRKPIAIFKGDDTDFEGNRKLYIDIESLGDLNVKEIIFSFLGVRKSFDTLPTNQRLEISFDREETDKFPLGTSFATLTAIDFNNKARTLDNRIAILVTNNVALAYCGDDDKLVSIKIGTINADIVPPNEEAQNGQAADAKDTYEALKELDEKINSGGGGSVEVVEPSADASEGQAADAKATYDALERKRDLDNLDYARIESYFDPGYILKIYNLDKTQLLKTVNLKLISERHTGTFVTKVWEYRTDNVQYQLTGELAGYESYDWRFIASDEYGIFFAPTWHTSLLDGLETDHTVTGTNCVYELQYSESIEFTKTVDDKIALLSQIPAAPDLSEYAKTAEVPAAIAGKEIKPSQVVMELEGGFGYIAKVIEITPDRIHYVKYSNEDDIEKEIFAPWDHIINAIPKYDFVDYGESGGEIRLFPFAIRRVSGVGEDISISILSSEGKARDMVLVVDATAETHILWEDGATTFHPRSGDAANLEVVAGKRNVFFITEVQPNVFMVARDELALPNEGGGE